MALSLASSASRFVRDRIENQPSEIRVEEHLVEYLIARRLKARTPQVRLQSCRLPTAPPVLHVDHYSINVPPDSKP